MKVYLILTAIFSSAVAKQLVSSDEITDFIVKKYIRGNLSNEENIKLQDAFEILYRPSYFRPNEYRTEIRMTLDCIICRAVFEAFFIGVQLGQTEAELIHTISILCTFLGIETENVCNGVVSLNLPILVYIVKNAPKATPFAFCSLVLQDGNDQYACPYDDPRFEWTVELPDPVSVPQAWNHNSTTLKTVIVTDAHIDPYYEAFGAAECGEPTCCRKGQTNKARKIFDKNIGDHVFEKSIIKDGDKVLLDLDAAPEIRSIKNTMEPIIMSPRNAEPAGYWGDYRNCDTPIWAYDDVIDTIAQHKDIDVVYYIGDTIDHHVWETTYELINETNVYLINKMRKSFGDQVLVIPAIGNHESQPTNQFAPSSVTKENLTTAWLYKSLAEKWDFYLTDEAKESLKKTGDFSMLVRPGLRVISLNNNVAYRYNWWVVYDPLHPKRHLEWLVQELYKAELAGEKVHILGHIPAGVNDFLFTWTREYNRVVNRFKSTIAAEFNGHTHTDEFKIFYSLTDGSPISVAWGGGSATTYARYNLNYKIATINAGTYEPENIVNYVYNLTEANLTPNRRPHWFQLYNMKNTYELTDLSPASMDLLVNFMATKKKHLLDLYSAFHSKISDKRWPYCHKQCKLDNLCRIVITVLWDRVKCNELINLFNS